VCGAGCPRRNAEPFGGREAQHPDLPLMEVVVDVERGLRKP